MPEENELRPTPETDKAAGYMAVDDSGFHKHPAGGLVPVEFARRLERDRDEARELCDFNAKQLLVAVNERNSLGVQLDLLRDELMRIAARWRKPSPSQLLELADRMRWEINPPEDESPWWVIYDSDHQLGGGIATGKTLREALESGWVREEYIMGRASNDPSSPATVGGKEHDGH